MSSGADPYRVLGVAKSDDADTIKKAYRKLARKLHPDRGGDPEKLKQVNAAYEIVGDDKKRKLFDEFGHEAFRPGFDAEAARRFKNFSGFGGGGASFDIEELMKMFGAGASGGGGGSPFGGFGGPGGGFGGGRSRGPRRGQDVRATLELSLQEMLEGSERKLTIGGEKAVTVRIPKGVRPNQSLRVPKKGLPGEDGGPPGDLLLEMVMSEHPLVRVDRDDLEIDLAITFSESIRGGSVTVPTPTGTVKVTIPPCAEAGTRLRLKGRGLPKGGKGTRLGDLYLILRPTPPEDGLGETADELDEFLDKLDEAYGEDLRSALSFDD